MESNILIDGNTNSDKIKHCAYCKNHGEIKPLSGHKPCPYNDEEHFLICKPCRKNRKKTINATNWRKNPKKRKLNQNENQGREDSCLSQAQTTDSATDFTDHQVMSVDSQMTDYNPDENFNGTCSININNDNITIGTIEADKMLETLGDIPADPPPITDTIQEESTDNYKHGNLPYLTMYGEPINYPDETVTHDEVEQFQSNLKNIIDEIPKNNRQPKFLVNTYSLDRWLLICANKYTKDWLENNFLEITDYKKNCTKPLKLVSIFDDKMYRLIFSFRRYDTFEKEYEIISSFFQQNRGLDTSLWEKLNEKESQDEVEVTFKIDPLSYKKIKDNNFILYIGGHQLKVKVDISKVKDWKGNSSNSIISKKTHGKIYPP